MRTVDAALVVRHVGGDRRTSVDNVGKIRRSMEYMLDRHGAQLARDGWIMAQYSAIAGVGAAQMGDFRAARSHLRRAVRARPREPKHWARLALATIPPAGRRVWSRRLAVPGESGLG